MGRKVYRDCRSVYKMFIYDSFDTSLKRVKMTQTLKKANYIWLQFGKLNMLLLTRT